MPESFDHKQLNELRAKIDSLNSEKNELQSKLEDQVTFIAEILRISEMAIVRFDADFTIIDADGALDKVFRSQSSKITHGENLIRQIYKLTHSIKAKPEDVTIPYDEREDIEKTVQKFISSSAESRDVEIVGEDDSGEVFLLLWHIIREGKNFKSFLRVIPTNSIVKSTQDHHKKQIKVKEKSVKQIFAFLEEGIIVLDMKYRITYMNEAAKRTIFAKGINLLKTAPVEGRFFREIFVHEEADEINARLDYLDKAARSKTFQSYTKISNDTPVTYSIYPLVRESGEMDGLIIVTSKDQTKTSSKIDDSEKHRFIMTMKKLSDEKLVLNERIKELEYNHQWFMKKHREENEKYKALQSTIGKIYRYLTQLPIAVGIFSYPDLKNVYINQAFEVLFDKTKKDVNGKTDYELMNKTDAELMIKKSQESASSRQLTVSTIGGLIIRQKPIFSEDEVPSHIIRLYEKQ